MFFQNFSSAHHFTWSACQFACLCNFIFFFLIFFLFPPTHTDNDFLLQSSDNAPAQPAPNQRVVEVAIPDVGTFVIESEEGGYDDEVHLIAIVCTAPPRCFLVLPDENFWHVCTSWHLTDFCKTQCLVCNLNNVLICNEIWKESTSYSNWARFAWYHLHWRYICLLSCGSWMFVLGQIALKCWWWSADY